MAIDPTTLEELDADLAKSTGGHKAITNKEPDGPIAITKVVRGDDGGMKTVYVDARTGAELSGGLGGYAVWNSHNYLDPSFTDEDEGVDKPTPSPAKQVTEEAREIGRGGRDSEGTGKKGNSSFGNDEAHNYGYINKPSGMGFANMLPGPLGMAAKAVNAGVNMNNVSAVNEARNRLGLEDQGFMGRVGGVMKDKQGQVADVTIGDANYSVGFEAQSPTGRTNMTPEEAAKRAQALGTTVKETPKTQVEEDERQFEKDYGKETGFFSNVRSTVASIFDAVNPFNDEDDLTKTTTPDTPAPRSTSFAGGGGNGGKGGYDGSSYSGQNAGQDTPSERGPGPGMGLGGSRGSTGASTSEANRGGGGATSGGKGLW